MLQVYKTMLFKLITNWS